MKKILTLGALATGAIATGMRNGCADQTNVFDASKNAYCEPAVESIVYLDIGGSGQYETVSDITGANQCSWVPKDYSGPLAPYDEEIAMIFRGPLKLRSFAAYSADASASKLKKRTEERKAAKAKRSLKPSPHERRHGHGHQHFHQRQKEARAAQDQADAEKRGVGDWVTAVIDGQLVSWVNTYAGPTAAADANAGSDQGLIGLSAAAAPTTTSSTSTAAAAATPAASANSDSDSDSDEGLDTSDASGSWQRISYYNAETKTREGLTFLNRPAWTNTLAFAGTTSGSQAAESTCFGGELEDAEEMIIMTDAPCSEDIGTECAYFKPGDEAFHGFGGVKKAFYFEFQMPDTGLHQTVDEMTSKYVAQNMPAIWTLNAKILTDQYGCNCQASGCGELDLFEVLNPGNERMKSTFHGNAGFNGGDSHYIKRPFDKYLSAVAVLDTDKLVIKVLPDGTEAPASLTQEQVDEWFGKEEYNVLGQLAVFAMSQV